MATKIRLQRQGRKRRPMFHIVVADSRAPRDGKYIERLGLYNPNTNPATITLDFDRSLYWIQTGAQPSDTANAILSYKGVLHKDHLLRGVKKGAFTPEQAEEKFTQWLESKESKIISKVDSLSSEREAKAKANLEREIKMKEAMAAKVLAKNSPLAEEVEMAAENEAANSDENEQEVVAAAEVATETVNETAEVAEVAEVTEVANETAEVAEEVVAETTEETSEPASTEEETPVQEA